MNFPNLPVGGPPVPAPFKPYLPPQTATPALQPGSFPPIDSFIPSFKLGLDPMVAFPWQSEQLNVEMIHNASANACEGWPVEYHGGKNSNASVAVIDSFTQLNSCQPVSHGYDVTQVLQRAGDLKPEEIQLINDGIRVSPFTFELFRGDGVDGRDKRVTAGIELSTVDSLRRTSRVLEEIASDPNSKIKTINQSQATNRYTVFSELTRDTLTLSPDRNSVELSPKGKYLYETFGLEPMYSSESHREFEKKAAAKIEEVISSSPLVKKELARHTEVSRKLADQGVSYVVAAGNQREDIRERVRAGVLTPNFDDSLYANPYNITVGAIDDKGTPDRGDDTLAEFSSICPEVDFLANGVNVPVQNPSGSVSGTSFSAPIVAGKLAQLRELHPDAKVQQLRDMLTRSSYGILDSSLPVVDATLNLKL